MKKFGPACLLLLFITGNSLTAQSTKYLSDKPGKWSYRSNISRPGADVAAFNKNLAALAEWFHLNVPMLTNPVGYDLKAIAFDIFNDQYRLNKSNYAMRAEMDFHFQLFLMSGGKWTVEPPHYEFCINNTEDGHGTNPNYTYFNYIEDDSSKEKAINEAASKLNGYFVVFPLVEKIAPGVNYYDCESGECGTVIVFNPDRPTFWIPVTLREFANASLNYLTLKSHDSSNDMMVIRLRQEIGELSEEELNAPAFSGDEEHFVLDANGHGNGFQIMRFNPDYWDRSLPPSAYQLLTLRYLRKSPEEMEEFERNNGHPDYSQLLISSVNLTDLTKLIQRVK